MSGSVESGPPDADADAVEVRAAELALERLQAVVAGQAAAEPRADVAERQVDLVVEDEHAVEVELEGAARGADRAAGLVHVGLRPQHRDARAAGAGAALGQLAGELLLGLRQLPAAGELLRDLEADVVRRPGVAGPGLPSPTTSQSTGVGAEEAAQDSSESACCSASRRCRPRPASPSACAASSSSPSSGSPSSPTSAVSVSISSSTGSSVGGVIVAMTVSSGSSRSVTPSGAVSADSVDRRVHLHAGDVEADRVRDVARQRLDVELARLLVEHAALDDAGRLLGAGQLERDRRCGSSRSCSTRSRSTCTVSPRTGWRWRSLTSTGRARAAVDDELEDRAASARACCAGCARRPRSAAARRRRRR